MTTDIFLFSITNKAFTGLGYRYTSDKTGVL